MRSASDLTCPRNRNSLDKALASTNYTSPFYSKENADSCYRHIYLASYEALPTLPVDIWEKCLCKLNPTCIPNAISKVSPMLLLMSEEGIRRSRDRSVEMHDWQWVVIKDKLFLLQKVYSSKQQLLKPCPYLAQTMMDHFFSTRKANAMSAWSNDLSKFQPKRSNL